MQITDPREIRRKKIIALLIAVAVVILLIVFVLIPALVKNNQAKTSYNCAMDLFGSGQYLAAAEQFEACGEYSDAEVMALKSYYSQAEILFSSQDYEGAADLYLKARSYSGAAEQYSECMYQIGLEKLNNADYSGTAQAFLSAGLGHKETLRYICSIAALSQEVPYSYYTLADRVKDSLYFDYGESIISNITGDGSIEGSLYGSYTAENGDLFVSLAGEQNQIIDAFLVFLKHVYGIDSSDVKSNLKTSVQQLKAFGPEKSFYLSRDSELMASFWVESGYYCMNCEIVPFEVTQQKAYLEEKGELLASAINQAAGETIARVNYVDNSEEARIDIKLLFSDDSSCFLTGNYDLSNDTFTIDTLTIGFDVGPISYLQSSYEDLFRKVLPVVYGVTENTFGLGSSSDEKRLFGLVLDSIADSWYEIVVEQGGDMWTEESGIYGSHPGGLLFSFQVVGNWFGGEIECSGYSF